VQQQQAHQVRPLHIHQCVPEPFTTARSGDLPEPVRYKSCP
jgi:hypothetical protein